MPGMWGGTRAIRAFSLTELVIVIVILGSVGAIAVPRITSAASGAGDSSLRAELTILRTAIEFYRTEHAGSPPTKASKFADQLTMYTDEAGNTSATRTGVYRFGPYLRAIPALPVGSHKGSAAVCDTGSVGAGGQGWHYDKTTGQICANLASAEVDSRGVPYNAY